MRKSRLTLAPLAAGAGLLAAVPSAGAVLSWPGAQDLSLAGSGDGALVAISQTGRGLHGQRVGRPIGRAG